MKKIVCYFIYYVLHNPVLAAKFLGVHVGKNCEILDNPWKVFGSEPYLISIGDNVKITNGVRFSTHDGAAWTVRNVNKGNGDVELFGHIVIKNNVFIGINSIILLNTIVEDNVIIGAMSLVKGYVKANSVYCGNPAKKIKNFNEYEQKIIEIGVHTKDLSYRKKKRFLAKEMVDL